MRSNGGHPKYREFQENRGLNISLSAIPSASMIVTERCALSPLTIDDRASFEELNQCPEVRRFLGGIVDVDTIKETIGTAWHEAG